MFILMLDFSSYSGVVYELLFDYTINDQNTLRYHQSCLKQLFCQFMLISYIRNLTALITPTLSETDL